MFDLILEFHLEAKPKRVMELLTDEQLISEWSVANAEFDPRGFGKYKMFDGWVSGEVLIASDNKLSYTWKTTDWAADAKPSEVLFILSQEGQGTKVVVKHTGLPSEEEMEGHRDGWQEHFFGPMEEYIETDEA